MDTNSADHASGNGPEPAGSIGPETLGSDADLSETRVRAVIAAARYHGTELDRRDFRPPPTETTFSPASLVVWLRDAGLWAKATRLRWKNLLTLTKGAPVVLLFNDGSAGLLIAGDEKRNLVWVKDPRAADADQPLPVDELRLKQVWTGDVLLVRRSRGEAVEDQPFSLGWLTRLVLVERGILARLAGTSVAVSMLNIVPPLLVMVVINQVLTHRSLSTLAMIALILAISVFFETLLTYTRRVLVLVLSARIDTRLNLHVFNRLLALPIDFFERNQAGKTTYEVSQIWRVREFLTGRMMTTFLDVVTLTVMVPVLFILSPTLAWFVIAGSLVIALIITAFLPALRQITGKLVAAESRKGSVMVETVFGIRTVKSLALENARKELWDERVAEAAGLQLQAGKLANLPAAICMPIERFIERGVLLIGAYFLLTGVA